MSEGEEINGVVKIATRVRALVLLAVTIVGSAYGLYAWAEDYHSQFAKEHSVEVQFIQTKLVIIKQQIATYEDQLFELEFRIDNDEASGLDRAKRQKIQSRLDDLRQQVHQYEQIVASKE